MALQAESGRRLLHALRFLCPPFATHHDWAAWDAYLQSQGLGSWVSRPDERALLDTITPRQTQPLKAEKLENILRVIRLNPTEVRPPASQPIPEPDIPLPQLLSEFHRFLSSETPWALEVMLEKVQTMTDGIAWPESSRTIPYWLGAKLEAGISLCVELGEGSQPICLVGGDVSGIQRFIYTISSRGALKSLRARSLMLDLFTRAVAAEIAERGAGVLSEVYVGGGRLYCLIPNHLEAEEWLNDLRRRTEEALYQQFGGKIGIALAYVRCSVDDLLGGASEVWRRLQVELSQAKYALFAHVAGREQTWQPQDTLPECDICRLPSPSARTRGWAWDTPEDASLVWCDFCWNIFKIGGKLPSLVAFAEPQPSEFRSEETIRFGPHRFSPLDQVETENPYRRIWFLADQPLGEHPAARRLPVGVLAAKEGDAVLSFLEIGAEAAGVPRIGAARVDADNVGRIFGSGLPEEWRTLAHLAALSQAYETFFGQRLLAVLRSQAKGERLTVIYSGGDDAFWVGPWDAVADSLFNVHRAFEEYVGGNPDVTISAGFTIANARYPVYHLAETAGRAEDASKTCRDAVTLWLESPVPYQFHSAVPPQHLATFSWAEAHQLRQAVVRPLFDDFTKVDGSEARSTLPRGWFRRLLTLSESYLTTGQLPFAPLAWTLARTRDSLPPERRDPWMQWARQLLDVDRLWKARPYLLWYELATRARREDPNVHASPSAGAE